MLVAVLRDGFGMIQTTGTREVIELSRDGKERRRVRVEGRDAGIPRVIGTSAGAAIGYPEGGKYHVQFVQPNGKLGERASFGKKIKRMCDGMASNDQRWLVAWVDYNGRLAGVGGTVPRRGGTTADTLDVLEPFEDDAAALATAEPNWCAVASAEDYVAIMWREGSRRFVNMCSAKECGVLSRMPLKAEHALLAVGCLRSGCLLAFRDEAGKRHLGWMTPTGKPQWTRPLHATRDEIEIVGAGNQAVAISYQSPEGSTVERVTTKGQIERAWADPTGRTAPAITWSKDRLLVTTRADGTIETTIVPMPR